MKARERERERERDPQNLDSMDVIWMLCTICWNSELKQMMFRESVSFLKKQNKKIHETYFCKKKKIQCQGQAVGDFLGGAVILINISNPV